MINLARLFIILGISLIILGGIIYLFSRTGMQFGRLPGDIRIERGNLTCIFGLGLSLMLSIVLTVILNIVLRVLNK